MCGIIIQGEYLWEMPGSGIIISYMVHNTRCYTRCGIKVPYGTRGFDLH